MEKANVVLVERSSSEHESFAPALRKRYAVMSVNSANLAVQYATNHSVQIIVLDAISMKTPGDRMCRSLKAELSSIPVIHLHPQSKHDSPADVVLHLPFTARKLVNNIERLIHNVGVEGMLIYGPFQMDLTRRVLIAQDQETQLTPKLALLVEMFLRNPGQVLDRKTLMEHVWQTDYLGDTRTLDVHIRWIRRAIETDPGKPKFLKTVRGVGYRLETISSDK